VDLPQEIVAFKQVLVCLGRVGDDFTTTQANAVIDELLGETSIAQEVNQAPAGKDSSAIISASALERPITRKHLRKMETRAARRLKRKQRTKVQSKPHPAHRVAICGRRS
jgi:hypothetical protein